MTIISHDSWILFCMLRHVRHVSGMCRHCCPWVHICFKTNLYHTYVCLQFSCQLSFHWQSCAKPSTLRHDFTWLPALWPETPLETMATPLWSSLLPWLHGHNHRCWLPEHWGSGLKSLPRVQKTGHTCCVTLYIYTVYRSNGGVIWQQW